MATKKPTTTKADTDETPEATRFEELRKRALDSGNVDTTKITDKPFVMGEEWGFTDDPITVERPAFTKSEMINENVRAGNVLNSLRLMFGKDAGRVAARLDTLGAEAGPAALLLIDDINAHFYGPGAAQVFPR